MIDLAFPLTTKYEKPATWPILAVALGVLVMIVALVKPILDAIEGR